MDSHSRLFSFGLNVLLEMSVVYICQTMNVTKNNEEGKNNRKIQQKMGEKQIVKANEPIKATKLIAF